MTGTMTTHDPPLPSFIPSATLYPQRPGEADCRDYLRTGRCKYGESCKYHHPADVESGGGRPLFRPGSDDPLEPPFPLRPGEPPCPYFLKHGTCKFGRSCKFHHPSGAGALMAGNGGSGGSGGNHGLGLGVGALGLGFGEAGSNVHGNALSFAHGHSHVGNIDGANVSVNGQPLPPGITAVLLQTNRSNPNMNVNNGHSNNHASGIGGDFGLSSLGSSAGANGDAQSQSQGPYVLPQRPSEPDCIYFLRNGRCKYGNTCKFHHPLPSHSRSTSSLSAAAAGAGAGAGAADNVMNYQALMQMQQQQCRPSRDRSKSLGSASEDRRPRSLSHPLLNSLHPITEKHHNNQGRHSMATHGSTSTRTHVMLPDGQIAVVLDPQTLHQLPPLQSQSSQHPKQAPSPSGMGVAPAPDRDRDPSSWRGGDGHGQHPRLGAPASSAPRRYNLPSGYGSTGNLSFSSSPMLAASSVSSYGNDTVASSIDLGGSHFHHGSSSQVSSNPGGGGGAQMQTQTNTAQFRPSWQQPPQGHGQGQDQMQFSNGFSTTGARRNDSLTHLASLGVDFDQRSSNRSPTSSGSGGSLSAYGSVDSGLQMQQPPQSQNNDYYCPYNDGLGAPATSTLPPQHHQQLHFQQQQQQHHPPSAASTHNAHNNMDGGYLPFQSGYEDHRLRATSIGSIAEEPASPHRPHHLSNNAQFSFSPSLYGRQAPPARQQAPPMTGLWLHSSEDRLSNSGAVAGHDHNDNKNDNDEGLSSMASALLTMLDSNEGSTSDPAMTEVRHRARAETLTAGPPPGLAPLDGRAAYNNDPRRHPPHSGNDRLVSSLPRNWPSNGYGYSGEPPSSLGQIGPPGI